MLRTPSVQPRTPINIASRRFRGFPLAALGDGNVLQRFDATEHFVDFDGNALCANKNRPVSVSDAFSFSEKSIRLAGYGVLLPTPLHDRIVVHYGLFSR